MELHCTRHYGGNYSVGRLTFYWASFHAVQKFLRPHRPGRQFLPWSSYVCTGLPPALNSLISISLNTWVERGTVRDKCIAQEHNTMSLARAQTWTTRSRDKRTNHEATAPSTVAMCYHRKFCLEFFTLIYYFFSILVHISGSIELITLICVSLDRPLPAVELLLECR